MACQHEILTIWIRFANVDATYNTNEVVLMG
jgi:hypothetical protein